MPQKPVGPLEQVPGSPAEKQDIVLVELAGRPQSLGGHIDVGIADRVQGRAQRKIQLPVDQPEIGRGHLVDFIAR